MSIRNILDEIIEDSFPIYFNGVDLSQFFYIKSDNGRAIYGREVELFSVPSRPGALIKGVKYPPRTITMEVLFACDSAEELRKKLEDLNDILSLEEPAPLIFHDEYDRTYYAISERVTEGYEWNGFHVTTITFICPDPHKYGHENKENFVNGLATVRNNGYREAAPVFEIEVLEDITYMDIICSDAYMRIGEPVTVEQTPIQREEVVMNYKADNTTGWTTGTDVDGGVPAGNFQTNGFSLNVQSYGTGSTWHGPTIKTSVPQAPLQDFIAEFLLGFPSTSYDKRSRVEYYLLNDLSDAIAKVAMKRIGNEGLGNTVEIRLGGGLDTEFLYVGKGEGAGTAWADFRGIMRIGRIGNEWFFYVAKFHPETGAHVNRMYRTYTDAELRFTGNLSQIQLHAGQTGTVPTEAVNIDDVLIKRVNTVTDNQVPYIAYAGDIIQIDMRDSSIKINGEYRSDLKDFGASFFMLPKGKTDLVLEPSTKLSGKVTFRERFL
ncbi:distal tail protein Dit [Jeotgalibacillus soli]|uniref:Phage tail protein n=1 Tax=Jeotgalibacillus soli TaxID=889306 RepID=A0A0C2V9X7_9BACL|nr:distal tail protein Dit [Jeotgalibacillus soli]KIL45767.1 hypothetical protein KP78_21160 [Jeotgalibacillus soli]